MLEKIRNQVAKDSAFDDWDDLCFCHGEMESIKRFEELTKFCDEASQRYAKYQTQELQDQNSELVSALQSIVNLQDKYFGEKDIHRVLQKKAFEIEELLTKYNHLNKKP